MSIYYSLAANIGVLKQIIVGLTSKTNPAHYSNYYRIFEHSDKLLSILKLNLQYQYAFCEDYIAIIDSRRLSSENQALKAYIQQMQQHSSKSFESAQYDQSVSDAAINELRRYNSEYIKIIGRLNAELKQKIRDNDDLNIIKEEMEKRIAALDDKTVAVNADLYRSISRFKAESAKSADEAEFFKNKASSLFYQLERQKEECSRLYAQHIAISKLNYAVRQVVTSEYAVYASFVLVDGDTYTESLEHFRSNEVASDHYNAEYAHATRHVDKNDSQLAPILIPPEAVLTNEMYRTKKQSRSAPFSHYLMKSLAAISALSGSFSDAMNYCQRGVTNDANQKQPCYGEGEYNDNELHDNQKMPEDPADYGPAIIIDDSQELAVCSGSGVFELSEARSETQINQQNDAHVLQSEYPVYTAVHYTVEEAEQPPEPELNGAARARALLRYRCQRSTPAHARAAPAARRGSGRVRSGWD